VWTSRPSATVVRHPRQRADAAADRDGARPFLFRLEQVSEDGGRTWTEKLFMMQPTRVTTIDGPAMHDYEIALERRNP
jgi:hypothetical protein